MKIRPFNIMGRITLTTMTCHTCESRYPVIYIIVWIPAFAGMTDSVINFGLSARQINEMTKIVEEKRDEIKNAWKEHFAG
jgi:hypothetical protein